MGKYARCPLLVRVFEYMINEFYVNSLNHALHTMMKKKHTGVYDLIMGKSVHPFR